jgi:hypothetical protein
MKRKVCTTILIAFLLLLLINVGTTEASEPGYERLGYPTVVEPTIDGAWTSTDEWTDGDPTMIGENVVFRNTFTLTRENGTDVCTIHFITEILNDNTNDAGDYWQICIDGHLDGGNTPQTDDFRIDIVGHDTLMVYQGNGVGWMKITPDANEVIFASSISASPTSSTPHWILEFSLLKTAGVITMDIVWGIRVAVYDESNSATGVQAWPPTDRDVPDGWGIENYTAVPHPSANKVATPTFNPAGGGIFSSAQNVTISCYTSGATIHYTLDESTPNDTSPVYSDPILVDSGVVVIKAIAVKSGLIDSNVASVVYIIISEEMVATPTFSPAPGTYSSDIFVTISCSTANASIHYTTDGSDPIWTSTVYMDPISVSSGSITIKAQAWSIGLSPSIIASANYTVLEQVATPTFNPAPGTYSSAQSVSIYCSTSDVTIRYTLDGSTPTTSSTIYTSPISVTDGTVTIKAMAFRSGWTESEVASGTYSIVPIVEQVATPTFSLAPGTYASAQSVSIYCSTSDVTIRYTLDGSTPTTSSTIYTSPISVTDGSVTIKAMAFRSGWTESEVASGTYSIAVTEPESNQLSLSIEEIAAIISLCGLTAGAGGWIFRKYSARKRHKILFNKLMEDIDDIYTRFKMNTLQCETELYKQKNQVLEDFKQGLIDEEKYNVLDMRINNYLREIEEEKAKERRA